MNILDKIRKEQVRAERHEFAVGDTIRIHVKIVEGDNERIQQFQGTVIARHGSGIEEKELPYIFDRYYRARSDAGRRGSGLGLSIVKAILVAHGAPFGVQSAVGQGADFWFELPPPAQK